MVDDFIEMSQRCTQSQHHCQHYSSFMRDFAVFTDDGQPVARNILGPHPLGVWPMIVPVFSSQCPIVSNFFGTINSTFKAYLEKHSLKIICVSLATRERDNGKNYYLAVTLGKDDSPYIACLNCNHYDCRGTFNIGLYARSLHSRTL